MLTKCPECELQVSDKAITCPHCGFPLVKEAKPKAHKKERMRLPNGFGQISRINNKNLRNPYRAMVTVGYNENGKPIQKVLKPQGYFPTYNEAYEALVKYNTGTIKIEKNCTLKELYDEWSIYYFKSLESESSKRTVESAWNRCSILYRMRVTDIRAIHIKNVIESADTPNMKSRIKSLFNLMLDYALEYELVTTNVARTFELSKDTLKDIEAARIPHVSFTDDEMDTLWKNISTPNVDILLIQCYMGWRPQELGNITIDNVDLENWTIIGGMKTEAGVNRIVPIHSCIRDLVKANYDKAVSLNSPYLFNCTDTVTHKNNTKLTYDKYRHRHEAIVKDLGLNPSHRAHDGRKMFVTMAKKYNVDEYAIKKCVGHKVSDITEAIYTDRDLNWLCSEIEKIKSPCN